VNLVLGSLTGGHLLKHFENVLQRQNQGYRTTSTCTGQESADLFLSRREGFGKLEAFTELKCVIRTKWGMFRACTCKLYLFVLDSFVFQI
jgi:hypothetical protein